MNSTRIFGSALLLFAAAAAAAAAPPSPAASVNLDGSTSRATARGPTLAASVSRQLRQDDVPSRTLRPGASELAAQAEADLAARDAARRAPRLKAERQNLKGRQAAQELARRQTPATYDRDIARGDKDHTQQVTNLHVYVQK
jgi:hypothetical protein